MSPIWRRRISTDISQKCAMRFSAVFQKKLYVRRIVRNSRGIRYRDHVLDVVVVQRRGNPRETKVGNRLCLGERWEGKEGGAMRGYMGCRRIVASVLRVLIWRHSARQFHLVLRGLSSSRPGHASHQDLISNHPGRSRYRELSFCFLSPCSTRGIPSKTLIMDFPLVRTDDALVTIAW